MGLIKGGFKRLLQSALYLLAFCCAGIVLGIYSYFLAVQADRKTTIPKWEKAVEGISGIAVIYTAFAVFLTCCLGGVSFFAFLAIVIDVLMIGGFVAMAILTRSGAHSCSGNVNTPIGSGPANSQGGFGSGGFGTGSNENVTSAAHLGLACRLNSAAFAVSIIGALLFVLTAVMQVLLVRHHKKEKRYGPSPANNYTSGTGKKRSLFGRKKNNDVEKTELGAAGVGAGAGGLAAAHHHNNHADFRPSHDTAYTGSTVAAPTGTHGTGLVKDADPIPHQPHAAHGAHGGYYTQPQGTGVNPYGYDNNHTATHDNSGPPPFATTGHHAGPTHGTALNY